MINLPKNTKTLQALKQSYPKIVNSMKSFQTQRFVELPFYIISQPQTHPDYVIYGIFFIDKTAVMNSIKNPNKRYNQIKQDLIAYCEKTKDIKYFRGLRRDEKTTDILRTLKEFNENFGGENYYGTYKQRVWLTRQHHFYDENDPYLPGEKRIKKLISRELRKIRKELKQSLSQ